MMQAEVFPYLPPSVLAEVGDRQRLRMLTARIGSAEDLVKLNRVLRHPSRTARASCPRTPSAPISTGSLVQKTARSERRAGIAPEAMRGVAIPQTADH